MKLGKLGPALVLLGFVLMACGGNGGGTTAGEADRPAAAGSDNRAI